MHIQSWINQQVHATLRFMKLIKCKKCGKSIEFKGTNHKYCESCSNETSSHLCHSCGEIIDNYVGHGQKYCETCSMKIGKEKARLRRERYRQQHTHLCLNCGKPIYNYKGYNHKIRKKYHTKKIVKRI